MIILITERQTEGVMDNETLLLKEEYIGFEDFNKLIDNYEEEEYIDDTFQNK